MSNQNICNICGANYEYRAGRWVCPACGAYKAEELSNEEVTLLYNAAQKLRLCDFNEAEIEYADIIEKFPKNPEGYWGRLLARYGIKYEEDFDGRKIPTCYATSIKSVFGDPDYEKAMSLFPEADRAYYKAQAEYIERVRKEWIEKASKQEPYDIFLCYKDSDLANGISRTPDSIAVQDIYIHLIEQGYRVFYSRESLRDKVGEKYEPYIFNALSTAKVMLVYGSKPEYITSTWLKNEWTRYEKRLQAGEKLPGSLLIACDGFSPDLLPHILSSRQCFDANKRSFYSDLDKTLASLTRKARELPPPAAPVYEVKEERNETKNTNTEGISEKDIDNILIENEKSNKAKILLLASVLAIVGIIIIFFLIPSQNKGNDANNAGSNNLPAQSTYNITYYLNGGINSSLNPRQYTKGKGYITLSAPTRSGYTFVGWYSDSNYYTKVTSINTSKADDIVLYAKWEEVLLVAPLAGIVTKSHNKDVPVFSTTLNQWQIHTGIDIAAAEGANVFAAANGKVTGVYQDPSLGHIVEITHSGDVVTIYANLEFNNINVKPGDTVKLGDKIGTIGDSAITELADEPHLHFAVKTNGSEVNPLDYITEESKKESLEIGTSSATYYITYNLSGGTNNPDNPTSFTKDSPDITLKDPSRNGYMFKGWYSDSGFTQKITVIDVSNTENLTLYAKWEIFPYTYEITDGEVTITGYTGGSTAFIPAEIEGKPVTKIGERAFENRYSLTSVTIPGSVETIGNSAFYNCDALTSVTIPGSVETIGNSAFSSCSALTSVTIEDGVKTIGNSAFSSCSALTSVTIPGSVETIGENAFYNCRALTSVTIPSSVETIGNFAFYSCSALTSVTIPGSVETIGKNAFSSCSALTSVTIEDGVKIIEDSAFSVCFRLASVTLGESLFFIGSSAFSGCHSLVEVYNLSDIEITAGFINNGSIAYYALDVYTSKDAQSSVRVESDGFIFYEKGDVRYLLGYVGSETEITLPESCGGKDYAIHEYAFYNSSLTSVTIPESVTRIKPYAFDSTSINTAVFAAPAGWYYSSYSDGHGGTDIPEANFAHPSVAASLLKSLESNHIFKKQ